MKEALNIMFNCSTLLSMLLFYHWGRNPFFSLANIHQTNVHVQHISFSHFLTASHTIPEDITDRKPPTDQSQWTFMALLLQPLTDWAPKCPNSQNSDNKPVYQNLQCFHQQTAEFNTLNSLLHQACYQTNSRQIHSNTKTMFPGKLEKAECLHVKISNTYSTTVSKVNMLISWRKEIKHGMQAFYLSGFSTFPICSPTAYTIWELNIFQYICLKLSLTIKLVRTTKEEKKRGRGGTIATCFRLGTIKANKTIPVRLGGYYKLQ